jgi:acetolactate synthase-1/2/3 large subunit
MLEQADVVLTVGYDMVEYPPRLWNSSGTKQIICVDFENAVIDRCYNPAVELIGDIGYSLERLTALTRGTLSINPPLWDFTAQQKVRKLMLEEFAVHKDDDTDGVIRPQKILHDVRQCLPPHGILLSGVGAHKMWIGRYFHAHHPNTVLIPNGFCSMGLALPGAIAANMVHPNDPVLAICGDGDFLMNVQEMETAKRLKSDITVMVWEDGGYGLISWKQENEFGRHTNLSFGNPNWVDLAHAFGWHCEHIMRSKEVAPALQRCIAHKGPALMVVPIDYRENLLLGKRLGSIPATL